MSNREQGMCLASVKMTSVIDPAEYKGGIVGIPTETRGMVRYGFANGKATTFHCLCRQTFSDSAQLSAHVFNATTRAYS